MSEVGLGPNGGLIYCFEFLLENLDFLTEALDPLTEEYLIIIDMPGQIELYTHIPILPTLVKHLTRTGSLNVNLCATYLLESSFVVDRAKFFAGTLSAMSAMLMLELPHVNVLSKMDLVKDNMSRKELKRYLEPDHTLLLDDDAHAVDRTPKIPAKDDHVNADMAIDNDHRKDDEEVDDADDPIKPSNLMRGASFKRLNRAVAQLIDDFSMISFLRLDVQEEDSVGAILSYIDDAIQYHEAQEPREPSTNEDDDMSGG